MTDSESITKPSIGPRELVYRNAYQQVFKVTVALGSIVKEIFVTDYGQRAAVVVEGTQGILLTRQYRHLINKVTWEIPGGKVDAGEEPQAAAQRECLEETGIRCDQLLPLLVFQPGLDTLHNPTHLFHSTTFDSQSDTNAVHNEEVYGHEWLPLERCLHMISSGIIVDSLSVIALLSYNTFIRQK